MPLNPHLTQNLPMVYCQHNTGGTLISGKVVTPQLSCPFSDKLLAWICSSPLVLPVGQEVQEKVRCGCPRLVGLCKIRHKNSNSSPFSAGLYPQFASPLRSLPYVLILCWTHILGSHVSVPTTSHVASSHSGMTILAIKEPAERCSASHSAFLVQCKNWRKPVVTLGTLRTQLGS